MKWPKLFKMGSQGQLLEWSIETDESTIIVRHGQTGGQIQVGCDTVRKGKNLGKANATTPVQQAEAEAASKWEKKQARERYVEDPARAMAGESDALGGIPPMLAHPYEDVAHRVVFPADEQPKFDGVRVEAVIDAGVCTLWSRKQEQMLCLPHIVAAYEARFAGVPGRFVFDGEAWRPGWSLQKISTFVRRKNETRPGFEEIGHYVYDVPSHEGTWTERRAHLEATYQVGGPLHLVETWTVGSIEEAWAKHDEIVLAGLGHDGAILRNRAGRYQPGKRTADLAKLKVFEDHEWPIAAVFTGRGKFEGLAMFTCRLEDGRTFDCTAPGDFAQRAAYLAEGASLIGKLLTVKHKGYSDTGIPLLVTGKAIVEG